MGLITRTFTYSAGAVILASSHNTNENTLYNLLNGNLDTSNISPSAAIVDTQLASITTAGKVNISALTVASQATGDIIYASSASVWARLGVGSNGNVLTLAAGVPSWAAGFTAASQAEMEATSSTTVTVTPGRAHFHPGVAKVWINFDGTDSTPITVNAAYGVNGTIVKTGTGDYTVTFTTAFSAATYAVMGTTSDTGAGSNVSGHVGPRSVADKTTTTCRFLTWRSDTNALTDFPDVSIVFFGDI